MNHKTLNKLLYAGWYTGRNININNMKRKYEEIGLEMPINVELFLREFGMLKFDPPDKKYYDVDFDPLKAIGVNSDGNYFRECLMEYSMNKMVYPIGVACRDNLIALMTVENKFYCFTDGCLIKAGDCVDDMLDCLVGECRDAEKIA